MFPHDVRAALAYRIAISAGETRLAEYYAALAGDKFNLSDYIMIEGEPESTLIPFVDKAANDTKNIVAEGVSEKCLIQLAYAIGVSKPLSIFIQLGEGDGSKIEKIKKIMNDNFNLSPRGIREMLKLNKPIYEITSAYGHFGRKPTNKGEFSWEKIDKSNLFKL